MTSSVIICWMLRDFINIDRNMENLQSLHFVSFWSGGGSPDSKLTPLLPYKTKPASLPPGNTVFFLESLIYSVMKCIRPLKWLADIQKIFNISSSASHLCLMSNHNFSFCCLIWWEDTATIISSFFGCISVRTPLPIPPVHHHDCPCCPFATVILICSLQKLGVVIFIWNSQKFAVVDS